MSKKRKIEDPLKILEITPRVWEIQRGFKTHVLVEYTDAIPYWLVTVYSLKAKKTFEITIDGELPKRGAEALALLALTKNGHGFSLWVKKKELCHTPIISREEDDEE